jgi:hypothetical protein
MEETAKYLDGERKPNYGRDRQSESFGFMIVGLGGDVSVTSDRLWRKENSLLNSFILAGMSSDGIR